MTSKYGYRLTAFRDGKKQILAEYRGDDTGLYRFEVERYEIKCCGDDCCGDEEVPCDGATCQCGSECQCK